MTRPSLFLLAALGLPVCVAAVLRVGVAEQRVWPEVLR